MMFAPGVDREAHARLVAGTAAAAVRNAAFAELFSSNLIHRDVDARLTYIDRAVATGEPLMPLAKRPEKVMPPTHTGLMRAICVGLGAQTSADAVAIIVRDAQEQPGLFDKRNDAPNSAVAAGVAVGCAAARWGLPVESALAVWFAAFPKAFPDKREQRGAAITEAVAVLVCTVLRDGLVLPEALVAVSSALRLKYGAAMDVFASAVDSLAGMTDDEWNELEPYRWYSRNKFGVRSLAAVAAATCCGAKLSSVRYRTGVVRASYRWLVHERDDYSAACMIYAALFVAVEAKNLFAASLMSDKGLDEGSLGL